MATILVLEPDPVSAALLEDRLHLAGHRVALYDDPAQAVSAASDPRVGMLILSMELPLVSGLEVIRQVRSRGESRTLPIVALSASNESADRVAALRAGAEDYLSRPFDLEELMLRIARLLGDRGEIAPVMQGDLASHPTWELVQYVQQAGKSGDLVIHGPVGSGRLQVSGGRVVEARFGELRGSEALLAILDTHEGSFRLSTESSGSEPARADPSFTIPEVLMQAAWLEDELAKRRGHLPATGVPLRPLPKELPPIEGELEELPFAEILERLHRQPGTRLFDLFAALEMAPSKVRLAVAWLVEQGLVRPQKESRGQVLTTTEISSSMVFDLAIHNLLSVAAEVGFDASSLHFLLLAEPEDKAELERVLGSGHGFRRIPQLADLGEQLELRQGGSADFVTDYGTLSLHVQVLTPGVRAQVEAIVPVCAGVLAWLRPGGDLDLVRGVVRRLEAVRGSPVGVLVARDPALQEIASELTAGCRRWRTARHGPQSLIGVLRLLHPQTATG